jgi:hypothetical protein
MDRLKCAGLSGNLLAFIFNLVSPRELEASLGWLDLKNWTYKGIPHGSALSPILHSVHIVGPISKIKQNCRLLEYADDLAVYSVKRHSRIAASEVEESVQNIEVCLKESGLEKAPNKCQWCIFDKKRESRWRVGDHCTKKKKRFFCQINYIFRFALKT